MKRLSGLSFRNKLLLAFLLIGVVPLLIFCLLYTSPSPRDCS